MFIDANLDPTRPNYKEFYKLLEPLEKRQEKPSVEIHRTIYERNRDGKAWPEPEEWKQRFCTSLIAEVVHRLNVKASVFLWKYMHDRFLITDLMGISLPNGFDIGKTDTTWSTISRKDRDSRQREFDPFAHRDKLIDSFEI
jgi:hypothetical protein